MIPHNITRPDKDALIAAFTASGMTNAEFARRAEISEGAACILRDRFQTSKIETIDKALRVFGKRVEIRVVDAKP